MQSVSDKILKRRQAVERSKANNREYYPQQKRELNSRPEYRAKMRLRYAAERAELKDAGILPRKMGRPRRYDGQEAIDMQRQRVREASARYKSRQLLSQVQEKDESTKSTSPSSDSD
jgi:hypothetical protein